MIQLTLWEKLISIFRQWNPLCVRYGHVERKIDGMTKKLGYIKGGKRPIVYLFSGQYRECAREGCSWNSYFGERRPLTIEEFDIAAKI